LPVTSGRERTLSSLACREVGRPIDPGDRLRLEIASAASLASGSRGVSDKTSAPLRGRFMLVEEAAVLRRQRHVYSAGARCRAPFAV